MLFLSLVKPIVQCGKHRMSEMSGGSKYRRTCL